MVLSLSPTERSLVPDLSTSASPPAKDATRKRWALVCIILGALLLIAGGGVYVAIRAADAKLNAVIGTTNIIDHESESFAGSSIEGAINLLLVGLDVAEGADRGGVLTDTIIIVHIPATHDQAYLISIPRDTKVDIPAEPKYRFRGDSEKINAAFGVGYRAVEGDEQAKRAAGVDMLAKTINKLTGIKFTGAVMIDMSGFKGVLRELGGVELCVDHRVRAIHLAYDADGRVVPVWYDDSAGRIRGIPRGGRELWFEVGCRHYDAELALEYSRLRKGLPNGDYDRQRNQQKLIKALVKKAMSKGVVTDLKKLDAMIDAGGKATVLDTGGVKLVDFVFTLKDVAVNDVVTIRTNPGTWGTVEIGGVSYVQLNAESVELFQSVSNESIAQFLLSHPEFLAPE